MTIELERKHARRSAKKSALAHTKIVATIGPASEDRIGELIDAGMSVARINLSHGTGEDFLRRVEKIRAVADQKMAAVGILTDIQGPKMRMGRFESGKRDMHVGDVARLQAGKGMSAPGD